MADKRFPIMVPLARKEQYADLPSSVPWALVEPHRKRAFKNHGQTLERLTERYGLSPMELWALLSDENLDRLFANSMKAEEAITGILTALLSKRSSDDPG